MGSDDPRPYLDARRLKRLWEHVRGRWTQETKFLMVENRLPDDDPPGPLMPLGEQDLPDYVIFSLRTVRDRFGTPLCLEVVCDEGGDVVVETVPLLP